jgi:Bacterial PH domain/Short C-terminal domain
MSYADGLLSTGERIFHREKQHPWVFVWGARYTILAVIIALVFGILSTNLAPDGISGTVRTVIGYIVAALFIGGLVLLGWTTLRYLNQEYVLTNRRVLQVEGVVNKRVVDSSLEKINDAVLEQSVFGRALGFGDLRILTASEAAISDFEMLRRPVEFKKAMLNAKYEYEREIAGTGEVVSPPLRDTAPATAVASPPMATPAAPVVPAASPAAAPPATDDASVTTTVPTPTPPAAAASAPAASGTAATMSSEELTRTLAGLADLRDRGAISIDDYERKKAEILGRL